MKLIDQTQKIVQRIISKLIKKSGHFSDNLRFNLSQLRKIYLTEKKNLYFTLGDLGKLFFDHAPLDVSWWAFRKLGVEEWLFKIVLSIYKNARS